MMRLGFDPGAQARLQGSVGQFERPGRQGPRVVGRQDPRFAVGDGDEDGDEFGMHGAFDGFGQGRCGKRVETGRCEALGIIRFGPCNSPLQT